MSQQPVITTQYSAFWLFTRKDDWREATHGSWDSVVAEFASVLSDVDADLTLRGVYSCMGLDARADLIVWVHAPNLDQLTALAGKLDRTTIGRAMRKVEAYVGMAGLNKYDPTHGPAFMKGVGPLRYMSVYPFIKSHDWYQIGFEERRRLMIQHGQLGREFPDIATNTIESCGVADQEFTIALEGNTVEEIINMAKKLRTAEVRPYTTVDTPIYLGERLSVEDALATIKG
ncbi:MAG: chlorite dismutase family protein [Thermomicrobiales bacterium]|nr:chlorite dismutase family protein [Thermomicrobiales bacterium]MCO5217327.1 chlorite dismutase family protein [Thermomicrobiales bacterium]MCO5226175.1 chlorite dismutase family protein [Thermomicrobiales bacterium]MCO5228710.1 chlorite dismutase family protein [Thermomicrobiales bacterium]